MSFSKFWYACLKWYADIKKQTAKKKKLSEYLDLRSKSVFTLVRQDSKPIPENLDEIRLFAVMRNESLRLPHFLEYYRALGVDRFFLLDNDSVDLDNSILSKADTHLFSIKEPYSEHWYWMEHLLENYGQGHWCMAVDIDELFYFPHSPEMSVRDLCNFLDSENKTAIRSFLLDLYPKGAVSSTEYRKGDNPLNIVSHFDKSYETQRFSFWDRKRMDFFTTTIFTGGMRDRVFGKSDPPSILSKVSLFKYLPTTYLVQGMHAINGGKLSSMQAITFHTKFLADFLPEVIEECTREQHYGGAFYYKIFNKKLSENPELSFYHENAAVFKNSQQLIDLKLMTITTEFEAFVAQTLRKKTVL